MLPSTALRTALTPPALALRVAVPSRNACRFTMALRAFFCYVMSLALITRAVVASPSSGNTPGDPSRRRLVTSRRRLTDNGAAAGGCCKCPSTSACWQIVSACKVGSSYIPCCYDGYSSSGSFCNGVPKKLTPTVAPYKLGEFLSNACAPNAAPIPMTQQDTGILCERAAIKLGGASATAIQSSVETARPKGCSTSYVTGSRKYYLNTGGSHTGALSTNGFQTICTEDYAYNVENTNVCPTVVGLMSVPLRIARRGHCATARTALGLTTNGFIFSGITSGYPRGCYYKDEASSQYAGVYFNDHSSTSAHAKTYPICNTASDYSYGVAGTNGCPAGKRVLASLEACQSFARAAFGTAEAVTVQSNDAAHPGGCYVESSSNAVWFNTGAGGGSSSSYTSVCTTKFAFGTDAINACAPGDAAITAVAECQEAADALGLVGGVTDLSVKEESSSTWNKGCHVSYMLSDKWEAAFNNHATGGQSNYATTICIRGTPLTTVTVHASTPDTAVSGVSTTFTFTGTKFATLGLPWVKVVASADACNAAGITGVGQLAATSPATETTGTLSITFDTTSTGTSSMGNKLCWSTTEAGVYDLLANNYIAVTLPPHTLTAITPTSVTAGETKTLSIVGTNFQTSGLPYIKVVSSTSASGCSSAKIDGTATSGRLVALGTPTETGATFEFSSTDVSAQNVVCMSGTEAGVYSAATPTITVEASPISAPTSAPTNPSSIGALAAAVQYAAVIEDGSNTTRILTLHSEYASAATLDEVATIECRVHGENQSAIEIVGGGIVTIDAAGVVAPVGTLGITVRGVRDALQLPSRVATVKCTISTPSGRVHTYAPEVTVIGTNQPSYKVFCPLAEGEDPAQITLSRCRSEMRTNGNTTIVIIGGDCATCPQPPFSPSTLVTIAGVRMNTTLVPGFKGSRVLTRTPTIREIVGNPGAAANDFTFGYYNFTISSEGDATTGLLGRRIVVSSSAESSIGGKLRCALRGWCPDIKAAVAGIHYIEDCIGYEPTDGTSSFNWNSADDAEAARFAFGSPSGGHSTSCRVCPVGCRCPGGDRCRAAPGYFLPGEDMYAGDGLQRCHPNLAIARKRCDGWTGLQGDVPSKCIEGAKGLLCAECESGWHPSISPCKRCKSEAEAYTKIMYIAAVFVVTFVVCFALVATVQGIYGNSIKSGVVRSMNFAGWVCSALAMQAQIGRTADSSLPDALQSWYDLLKLFEFNPDGARPMECSGGSSAFPFVALGLGIALPLIFMLLEIEQLQVLVVKAGGTVLNPLLRKVAEGKEKKKVAKASLGEGIVSEVEDEQQNTTDNPMGRARAARARADTNRMEIELVMNPMGRKEASENDANVPESVAVEPKGAVVNKHARLSELFILQRDTLLEAWLLDEMEREATAVAEAFERDSAKAEAAATTTKKKKKRCCQKKKKKKKKTKTSGANKATKTRKGGKEHCEIVLGNFRKFILSGTIFFHPIVVNTAFNSLNCVRNPASGALVLANKPGTVCFEGAHWPLFILSVAALLIEAALLPLFVLSVVGHGVGWFTCRRGEDEREILSDLDETAEAKWKYGTVHAGVCLRCLCCVNALSRARSNFIRTHDKQRLQARVLLCSHDLRWGDHSHRVLQLLLGPRQVAVHTC